MYGASQGASGFVSGKPEQKIYGRAVKGDYTGPEAAGVGGSG